MSADLNFLYDQILEGLCRLDCLAHYSKNSDEDDGDDSGDVGEDIDHVVGLLAKRDLLVFASSIRNFAEATKSIDRMKRCAVKLSEVYLSRGPPYFRESMRTINLYQTVSRVLHSYDTTILRVPNDFILETHEGNSTDLYRRLTKEPSHFPTKIEPVASIITEREGRSHLKLANLLDAARRYLDVETQVLAKNRTFVQRSLRDV